MQLPNRVLIAAISYHEGDFFFFLAPLSKWSRLSGEEEMQFFLFLFKLLKLPAKLSAKPARL